MLAAIFGSGCATGLSGWTQSASESGAVPAGYVLSDAGGEVEYWFEYGRTEAYGFHTEHRTLTAEKNVATLVRGEISGLERSTPYHVRLCAKDAQQQGGPGCGEDVRFKTQSFACGETVTMDVRLTASMECVGNYGRDGLFVGASGIDINLAGFSFRGPVDFLPSSGPTGIVNAGGYDDITVRDGSMPFWGSGINLEGAARTRIANLRLPTHGGYAIRLSGADDSEIRHVDVTGSVSASESDRVVMADSTIFGSGVALTGDDNRVVRNEVGPGARFTAGITVGGSRNHIADNHVESFPDGGLLVTAGSDNVVRDNQVLDGWFYVGGPDGQYGDGIFIGAFTAGTLLRGNVATGNAGDGIEVQGTATRLGDNAANDNGDFGIDAAAGVTDLGGNTATGNGNPLQCRNVLCQ